MKRIRLWQDERGIALAQTIIGLMALMGLTVLGTDLGRLAFTATEVQTAAEVAATAGARSLIDGGSAQAAAETLVGANTIDGHAGTGANIDSIETGSFDHATGAFLSGGTPATAVRATTSVTINNLLAGLLGSPTSLVTKTAIASFSGLGNGTPTLPLVIGDDNFDEDCFSDDCMPTLIHVPSPEDNVAWTGFFDGASTSNISDYFPSEYGGGGESLPPLSLGDDVSLNNGQETPLLNIIADMVDAGVNEFVIPVVDSTQFNQTGPVVGFATIVIDEVITTGTDKGITLHAIFNSDGLADGGGVGGGGNFGTGLVQLVG
jgi:Flp pilus assembly protein TadG